MKARYLKRLLASFTRTNDQDCWIWKGMINGHGYGQFYAAPLGRPSAHRVVYELNVGPIPKGLVLDHLCRNPPCVNPLHLEPVTRGENTRRGLLGGKTHCPLGHRYDVTRYKIRKGKSTPYQACRTCEKAAMARYYARKQGES